MLSAKNLNRGLFNFLKKEGCDKQTQKANMHFNGGIYFIPLRLC
jgi:hypothetical protein